MKRHTLPNRPFLRNALVAAAALTALAFLKPSTAEAGLVIRASIGAPVTAQVVVAKAPRGGVLTPALARRTIVTQERLGCCCDHDRRPHAKIKRHRRHRHHRMIWVPGHWERVSPRTSRWVSGHWERI